VCVVSEGYKFGEEDVRRRNISPIINELTN
jgi:hypothetical protein